MTIELAHVPTYIKEAAGKLHRHCQRVRQATD